MEDEINRLREKFLRDVENVRRGAYSQGGQVMYGKQPSNNYAQGPLPDYFAGRENYEQGGALFNAGLAGLGAGTSAVLPEAAPFMMPWAGASANMAVQDYADSKDMGRAADMWSNTGMPQRPQPVQPPQMDIMDVLMRKYGYMR